MRSIMAELQRRLHGTQSPCRQFPTSGFEEETYSSSTGHLYYPAKIGQVLHSKYQIVGKLGYGTTSTVWMCQDLR